MSQLIMKGNLSYKNPNCSFLMIYTWLDGKRNGRLSIIEIYLHYSSSSCIFIYFMWHYQLFQLSLAWMLAALKAD